MRLIDLDNPKVTHLLCNLDKKAVPGRALNNEGWFEELGGFIYELLKIADEEPIDAVPVVRCKDCEYWVDYDTCQNSSEAKHKYCALLSVSTHSGFYCGLAERKTEKE